MRKYFDRSTPGQYWSMLFLYYCWARGRDIVWYGSIFGVIFREGFKGAVVIIVERIVRRSGRGKRIVCCVGSCRSRLVEYNHVVCWRFTSVPINPPNISWMQNLVLCGIKHSVDVGDMVCRVSNHHALCCFMFQLRFLCPNFTKPTSPNSIRWSWRTGCTR
jgi:hypothetical protein